MEVTAEELVEVLEGRNPESVPILRDARRVFTKALQRVLDLLSDISKKPGSGPDEFAKIGLASFCVTEMLAAFHLAQHSFVNQAYAHIRSVFEHLDKIELFHEQPEWAELWCSDKPEDAKRVLLELKPAAVREKLGRPRYDPLYAWFSELGTHSTFNAIRSFSAKTASRKVGGRPTLQFWIGGCPFEHNIIFINSFLLLAGVEVTRVIRRVYAESLTTDAADQALVDTGGELLDFITKYLVQFADQCGIDTRPLMRIIEYLSGK